MCNRTSSSFFCADDLYTTSHRFVTNTAHRRHSFSLACKCETENVRPAGVRLLLGDLFVNMGLFALLPHLHRRDGGFRPMRGVRLPHGAYFERERDRTCHYCTFALWDVCSTRHPDFCHDTVSLTGLTPWTDCLYLPS